MDIIRRRSLVLILFLVFLFSTQNYFILSLGTMNIICKPSERTALLSFKQHLKYYYDNSLSSWSGVNCCKWAGVVCSNTTDHVVQLHLQGFGLRGELNPSLQELKQLTHLDLSSNNFQGIPIPDFLGTLQSLRYLNLSRAGFRGMIPHQLGNLSNLRYLDLSSNYDYKEQLSVVGDFQWISHLSSLKYLDLSWVNHANASSNWFHVVNMPPSLLVLRLSSCSLSSGALSTSLSHVNFTSLEVLYLSRNNFISTLPEWLYSLTNLQQLDLSDNRFQGTISPSIGNLTKLTLLDLSRNQLSGPLPEELDRLVNLNNLVLRNNSLSGSIPSSIGRLSLLKVLDLGNNKLHGSLPQSLGKLSKLVTLYIAPNVLEGVVSEIHFANLTSLQYLSIGSLVLKMSPEWVPPFQLIDADLNTCQLGPGFPIWLRSQKNLISLKLSRTGISGTIPTWFWYNVRYHSRITGSFESFDLSYNELNGGLPKVINATSISLKSNQFSGQLPLVSPYVIELDLSKNSFSGPISTLLCNPISEFNALVFLDLSDNLLSGDLSECWVYWASLASLRLGGNKITGKIPNSMGSLPALHALHLSNNHLSGELPSSLRNCGALYSIDLGENEFTGRLPTWLGESFHYLEFLRLRSNKFYGKIPLQLCYLATIRILDIADNDLVGSIPKCFNNFSAMAQKRTDWLVWGTSFGEFVDKMTLVTKGKEVEINSLNVRFVASLDLSKNSLSGEIPEELTSLVVLISLNLSDNHFTGKIPEKISNMSSLESLDFSRNRISGVIPLSIAGLSFLSYLNLSYNNLSGEIPRATQLLSFTNMSFIGNQQLCGLPLKNCNEEDEPSKKSIDIGNRRADEDWFEMKWFYFSMGVGFLFGFLGFLWCHGTEKFMENCLFSVS